MIFETLWDSSKKGELILIENGFCHFHLRKDGQLTIREIISQQKGCGKQMLDILISKNPKFIFAKCPADLESNGWYKKMGFVLVGNEISKNGRTINHWKLNVVGETNNE